MAAYEDIIDSVVILYALNESFEGWTVQFAARPKPHTYGPVTHGNGAALAYRMDEVSSLGLRKSHSTPKIRNEYMPSQYNAKCFLEKPDLKQSAGPHSLCAVYLAAVVPKKSLAKKKTAPV